MTSSAGLAVDHPLDEDELVRSMVGYQAGRPAELERLWDLLAPSIRSFFRQTAGDPDLAEGLLVETFHEIHAHRHTYRPPNRVARWALDIADHVRRTRL